MFAEAVRGYTSVQVGDPRAQETLLGPLIDRGAFENMERALTEVRAAGGTITGGERVAGIAGDDAFYVRPALAPPGFRRHRDGLFTHAG